MLDTVHNQGLRLALGAFRTSPVSSLNVEADEPSLWLRREKLSLQYAIRLAANPSIFTAESKAIDMALDYVMNNSLENKFVIFSDSLSVLKSLNHTSSKNPKIQNVIEQHHELSKTK